MHGLVIETDVLLIIIHPQNFVICTNLCDKTYHAEMAGAFQLSEDHA